jgi:hypoxanthine phosphoribosyltransferase
MSDDARKIPDADAMTPKVSGLAVEDPDIDSVLFDATMIEGALETLAVLMVHRMADFEVYVPVTTGALMFASDLIRQTYVVQRLFRTEVVRPYARPVVACASASSYGDGTTSAGTPATTLPRCEVRGKRVVLIEDIIDTGRTCVTLAKALYDAGAEEVAIVALMDKREHRDKEATAYFESKNMKMACAFQCPDEFVVGYGLDYQGKYRDLPFVGILKPEVFAEKK